jgi:hypothetical protein
MAAVFLFMGCLITSTRGEPNSNEDRLVAASSVPALETMINGPWRYRPVQGRPFWFTLGGAEESAVHATTLSKLGIADSGLQTAGVAEWCYSFHHLKDGQVDGAGTKHYGGYPQAPQSRAKAAEYVRSYYDRLAADVRAKATESQRKLFSSINGHYCYQHYACEWGCDIVGSEVGENINSIQAHIAFTRGAARQYGKPWLMDFSSWYGPSMYDEDPRKHWGEYSGPTRGHSLSLHRRTYYASYMAGAEVVVAEGGWLNFFRSQQPGPDGTLPLSQLGEEGRRFYRFTQRHPDRGLPYIPMAVLADFHHGIYPGFGEKLAWHALPYTPGDQRLLDLWEAFFPDSVDVQVKRNEKGYLVASPFGDTMDVILTNAPDDVLSAYSLLIVAGELTDPVQTASRLKGYVSRGGTLMLNEGDAKRPAFVEAFGLPPNAVGADRPGYTRLSHGKGALIIYSEAGPAKNQPLLFLLRKAADELVPLRVSGKLQVLYNRTADGWLVTLINNEGITKTFHEAATIDPEASQRVNISYTGDGRIRSAEGWGEEIDEPLDPERVEVVIVPGDVRVIRLVIDQTATK